MQEFLAKRKRAAALPAAALSRNKERNYDGESGFGVVLSFLFPPFSTQKKDQRFRAGLNNQMEKFSLFLLPFLSSISFKTYDFTTTISFPSTIWSRDFIV